MSALQLHPLPGLPEIGAGVDLAAAIAAALAHAGLRLEAGDVIAVAQKVVSKAEGRVVRLAGVTPGERASDFARITGKDPRYVEVVLRESIRVVRAVPGVLIVEHRLGHVMANAGIDQSNVPGEDRVLLLPADPDASAAALREQIAARCGVAPAVLVTDSFGRPWRQGVVGVALGVAGLAALEDRRGRRDRDGRVLRMTQVAVADALAAAAVLAMGEGDEGTPVVLARGVPGKRRDATVRELFRRGEEDLFR